MNLSEAIEAYIDGYLILQGRTVSTRRCYSADLRMFEKYCAKTMPREPEMQRIERMHIEEFLHHEYQRGMHSNTVRRRISVIKHFFEWAEEMGLCEHPAPKIPVPKYRDSFPYCPSREEVESLIANCYDPTAHAIICTLFFTGLRIGELCSLRIDDVDLKRELLLVRNGKGHKDRQIPLNGRVRSVLERYLANVRPDVESDRFFSSRTGKISIAWASQLLRREKEREGIQGHLTPHSLRHAFATELYRNGCDLRELQILMGHASLHTLQVYVHLSMRDLQEAVSLLDSR